MCSVTFSVLARVNFKNSSKTHFSLQSMTMQKTDTIATLYQAPPPHTHPNLESRCVQ